MGSTGIYGFRHHGRDAQGFPRGDFNRNSIASLVRSTRLHACSVGHDPGRSPMCLENGCKHRHPSDDRDCSQGFTACAYSVRAVPLLPGNNVFLVSGIWCSLHDISPRFEAFALPLSF